MAICRDRYACAKTLLAKGADLDIRTRSIRQPYKELIAAEYKRRHYFAAVTKPLDVKKSPIVTDKKKLTESSTGTQTKQRRKPDSHKAQSKSSSTKAHTKQPYKHRHVGADEPEKSTDSNEKHLITSKQISSRATTVERNASRIVAKYTSKEELASAVTSYPNELLRSNSDDLASKSSMVAKAWSVQLEEQSHNEETAVSHSRVRQFLGKNPDAQQESPPATYVRATKGWIESDTPDTEGEEYSPSVSARSLPAPDSAYASAPAHDPGTKNKKITKKKKKTLHRRVNSRRSFSKTRKNFSKARSAVRGRIMPSYSAASDSLSPLPVKEHRARTPYSPDGNRMKLRASNGGVDEEMEEFTEEMADEKVEIADAKVAETKVDEKVGDEEEHMEEDQPMTLGFILASQELMKKSNKSFGYESSKSRPASATRNRPVSARRARKVVSQWKRKQVTGTMPL